MERLERHARSQQEQLEEARKLAAEFQRDVRAAVERIDVRRREELRSSRGGRLFEDAVLDFVQQAVGGTGYLVENTGAAVGLRPGCKVGDAVIQFPRDHAFHGARVVVEAKHDKGYTVSAALEEIERARDNRGACAGVFVMAKSHACPGFPMFSRYGSDVLVTWDPESSTTDPYLVAALTLALALTVRQRATADEGDLRALQAIEQRITAELERLETIQEAAAKIRKQTEIIERAVGTGTEKLKKLLGDAQQTLRALKVEVHEEAVERASPIGLLAPANDDTPADAEEPALESTRGLA